MKNNNDDDDDDDDSSMPCLGSNQYHRCSATRLRIRHNCTRKRYEHESSSSLSPTTRDWWKILVVLLVYYSPVATAFLGGVHKTNPKQQQQKQQQQQRYTFSTHPDEPYFTCRGILPPLVSPVVDVSSKNVGVTYTNDPNTVSEWLSSHVPPQGCFLGFDIERLPAPRSRHPSPRETHKFSHAAVVQLATPHACLVVHLLCSNTKRHSNDCAPLLKRVLENPAVVKAGCSIDEDLVLLHELWSGGGGANKNKHKQKHAFSLDARSRFDLGCVLVSSPLPLDGTPVLATTKTASTSKKPRKHRPLVPNKSGLQGLCKSLLRIDLPKDPCDCQSDWTVFPLSDHQITYAARDAWAGAVIATQLETKCDIRRPLLKRLLAQTETPLPQLAHRHRRRKKAKIELQALLHPYEQEWSLWIQQQQQQQQQQQLESDDNDDNDDENDDRQEEECWQWHSKPPFVRKSSRQKQHRRDNNVAALFAIPPRSSSSSTSSTTLLQASATNTTDYCMDQRQAKTKRRNHQQHLSQQKQRLENKLPKTVRQKTTALRQQVNARVIDHKVVFEINLLQQQHRPSESEETETSTKKTRKRKRNRKKKR